MAVSVTECVIHRHRHRSQSTIPKLPFMLNGLQKLQYYHQFNIKKNRQLFKKFYLSCVTGSYCAAAAVWQLWESHIKESFWLGASQVFPFCTWTGKRWRARPMPTKTCTLALRVSGASTVYISISDTHLLTHSEVVMGWSHPSWHWATCGGIP